MTTSFKGSAQSRMRDLSARFDRLGRAPLTWLITGGLVLMLAIAVGTGLAVERFRQDAIDSGREGLESAVLLLARHFDRQFEDFSVLQKSIVLELESHGFDSPDVFRSEMGTLAMHEVLRSKASGLNDVAGANVFDSNGVTAERRWDRAGNCRKGRYSRHEIICRDYFPCDEAEMAWLTAASNAGPSKGFRKKA